MVTSVCRSIQTNTYTVYSRLLGDGTDGLIPKEGAMSTAPAEPHLDLTPHDSSRQNVDANPPPRQTRTHTENPLLATAQYKHTRTMGARRRHHTRKRSLDYTDTPITIRIGNRHNAGKYREIQVTGSQDAGRFGMKSPYHVLKR